MNQEGAQKQKETRPSERKGDWRVEFWVMSAVWLIGMTGVDVINGQVHG